MKPLLLAAAVTLAAAPVLAQQFDGSTSAAEFAARHFAKDHETGDGPRYVPGTTPRAGTVISTSDRALAAFAAEKLRNGREDER